MALVGILMMCNILIKTINSTQPFREEFFFIMNIAVGGDWPGSPNSSTVFPQRMVIDYVRVFQNN